MTALEASGVRRNDFRARGHAGFWAFAVHRASGIALALFLPMHFWVLGLALQGAAGLDAALAWTRAPFVEASEVVLVFLLAVHLGGGFRLLLVEFGGWRAAWQPAMIAGTFGVAIGCSLLYALNLY